MSKATEEFKKSIGTGKRTMTLSLREAGSASEISKDDRTIKGLPVSSETVIDRKYYREVLVHEAGAVDLTRFTDGAALLADHNPSRIIGVIEGAEIRDDKRLYVDIRFSRSPEAEIVFQDVLDGIRRNVSIGYDFGYDDYEEVKEHPDKETDEPPLFRIFRWEPVEVSFVANPADPSVGVGRSKFRDTGAPPASDPEPEPEPDKTPADPEPGENQEFTNNQRNIKVITMTDETKLAELEKVRKEEITALGTSHNLPYDFAIRSGMTIEQYRAYALENIPKNKPLYSDGHLDEKEMKDYSLSRAIRNFDQNEDCYELEVHRELSKKFSKRSRGLLVPQNVILAAGRREASATNTPNFVGTQFRPDMFIDARRPEDILGRLGVNIMTGLKSNIDIPKLKQDVGFGWAAAETTAVEEGVLDDDQIEMSPKRGGIYLELTKRLLTQSDLNVEMVVRNSIFRSLQNSVTKVLHHGSVDAGIDGIEQVAVANKVTAANIDRLKLITFKQKPKQLNASGLNMYWVGNSNTIGILQSRPQVEGQAIWLCSDINTILMREAMEFSLIEDNYLFYGNYENVYIGYWGPFEILVNPFAKDTQGIVRLTLNAETDIAFAHAESFSFADDVS